MLGVNQLDFLNYTTALKGNYRKGAHKLRAILGNPTHAAEFAANLGGVSVVLGVPISTPDKNSTDLLTFLLASSVADAAITTWLTQWYEFDGIDDLLNDAGVCSALLANPLTFRAVNTNSVYMGKIAARLAGLSPASYANMTAVAASPTAMTAVAASSTAMAAVIASPTALNAVVTSSTAMTAVAASSTAMAAVAASPTALNAINASTTALNALYSSPLKQTYNWSGGNWTANPATIRSGSALLVRVIMKNNSYGGSVPGTTDQYVRINGSGFTTSKGRSSNNLYVESNSFPQDTDFAARLATSSITAYLYSQFEIAYIPVS